MSENVPQSALSQDITHVEREYRKNVTVVTTRPRIVEAAFLAWGAVVAFFLLFFLFSVAWYGVQGMFDDNAYENALLANSGSTHTRLQAAAPESLLVGDVQSLSAGSSGEYDMYVQIENPNTRHAVEFSYTFTHDNGEGEVRESFLNPGETAYIVASRAATGRPKNAAITIDDISWTHLSTHEIKNVAAWYSEHAAFSVASVMFAGDIAYANETVSRTTFTVTNHTPYSYWEPAFTVRILRGSTLLGIADITSTRFLAGEERTIDMRWFGDLPQTATVTVTPRIPYFDERAFMNPEESSSSDVRSRWTVED